MKITFIKSAYINVWEPIGIGYIISYLKQNSDDKDLDIQFFDTKFDNDLKVIRMSTNSDIVAFSDTSPTFQHSVDLARTLKHINPKIKMVFGGWHVTALGEKAWVQGVMDHIVVGEGEEPMLQIVEGLDRKIVYGSKLDFNDLPHPDRKIIKAERYLDLCEQMTGGLRIASFNANRGCPMSCTFCSERAMTGKYHRAENPVRSRDHYDLISEIYDVWDKYKINYFKFVDATFDHDPNWVMQFCMKVSELPLPWEAMIHASFATEEMIRVMAESTCTQVNIGVESGSNRILKKIRKGANTNKIAQVFDWCHKYGLKTRGFFIVGVPGETEKDYQLTEEFIDRIRPDMVGFTLLCPYPGSDYYNHDTMKNIKWSETDEYGNDFWETRNFTNKQLRAVQARFVEKYNTNICERQKA